MSTQQQEATSTELVEVVSSLVSDEKVASEITQAMSNFFISFESLKQKASKIEVTAPDQIKEMKAAKETRLEIKRERLSATDVVKSKRENVKSLMASYKAEDTAWLRIGQLIDEKLKPLEESLEAKEKFAENYAIEQMNIKREQRGKIMQQYAEFYPVIGIDLGVHTDEEFEALVQTAKVTMESILKKREDDRIAEEKEKERLELERIARERIQKRKDALARIPMVLQAGSIYVCDVTQRTIDQAFLNESSADEFEGMVSLILQERSLEKKRQEERQEILRQRQSEVMSLGFTWDSVNKGFGSILSDHEGHYYFFSVTVIEDDNAYQTEFDKAKEWVAKTKASIEAAAEAIPVKVPETPSFNKMVEPTNQNLITDVEIIEHFIGKCKDLKGEMADVSKHMKSEASKQTLIQSAALIEKVIGYIQTKTSTGITS